MPWSPAASVRSEDFIRFPSGTTNYFSEQFTFDDFNKLNIPVTPEMQKRIASLETLAQLEIQYIFSCSSPISRFPLRFQPLTNNSVLKLVAIFFFDNISIEPFLERLTFLCTISGMELELSHISSDRNEEADALSRWIFHSDPPFGHELHNRFAFSLDQLWHPEASISLHPPETYLAWQTP